MALVSWAKKELGRLKMHSAKRLLLPPQTTLKASPKSILHPSQVVLAADLRCIKCQERVAAIASTISNDLESIVVHVREKKVELTRKTTINH